MRKRKSDLPVGVRRTWNGKYSAQLPYKIGKKWCTKHLGTYDTVTEAKEIYDYTLSVRDRNKELKSESLSKKLKHQSSYVKKRQPDDMQSIKDNWQCIKCGRKYDTGACPMQCTDDCGSMAFEQL